MDDPITPDSDETAERGISRRQLLARGAAAGVAVGAAGTGFGLTRAARASSSASEAAPPDEHTLVLVNGHIHTMDDSNRVVSRVVIRNGRFAAVDSGAAAGGEDVTVVNLKGRTVVPGLIDSHTHIVLVGNRPGYHTPLEDVFTIPDVIARYRARRADVPAGQFITTIGPISAMQLRERRLPNLTELDAIDRPIFIEAAQGGAVTNSLGKAFFESNGITIGADGSIAGTAFGTGPLGQALKLLRERFLTPESRERTSLESLQYYAKLGLTTHLDQGAFQADTPNGAIFGENKYTMHFPFLALNAQGKLPARLRINFLQEDEDPALPTLRARLLNSFPFFGDEWFRTGGIGEFTAQGIFEEGGPVWFQGTRLVAQARWRNENHSLTPDDFKRIIEGWERVNSEFPIGDLRWVIAHVPFITEEYVNRLKALGGGVKVGWGPVRTGTKVGPPYRMIVDNGIHVGYHADGGDITVINPWLNFYTIITGRNLQGDLINEGQTLTRQETMQLATSANAWFIHEDDIGSIKVGNHGDLVVLDRDFFSVPEEQIKQIRSVLTVVGGKVVHDEGVL
jgi:predicted amidohydrolase YtcJ